MYVAIAANAVNALAGYALIYGRFGAPRLGVLGAGYATTIARLFMVGAIALVIWGSGRYAAFGVRLVRPSGAKIRRLLRLGLPVGGQLAAEVGVFSATGVMMERLGPAPLAAHQVALSLASLTFMVPLGLSIAASVRIGQALGRRAFESARVSAIAAYAVGVGFMTVSATTFALAAGPLARLFSEDQAVVAIAVVLIRVAALFQISDGAQVIGAGCLRGAADTRAAFLVNVLGHWAVGLPVGLLLAFPLGLGARGLWLGLSASLTVVAVFLAARFFSEKWRATGTSPLALPDAMLSA